MTQTRELGESLFDCNRLQKKMQSLKHEIDNHEPWIEKICQNGREMIDEGHENSSEFQQKIDELMKIWQVISFTSHYLSFPFDQSFLSFIELVQDVLTFLIFCISELERFSERPQRTFS